MLRKYSPKLFYVMLLTSHIDHGKGSKLVSDACFLSGLTKVETELDGVQQRHGDQK
jgi:hypothetical protein